MSVIFGMLAFGGRDAGPEAPERMEDALRFAAPNGSAYELYGPAALGLGVLHIVPEDRFADGPATHPEGRFSLVGEGLIHNRPELRETLKLGAAQTAEWTDAHWMLAAFARWGERAIDHLVGEYCFAVWDARERRLTLMRDPLGRKHTLFTWRDRERLFFATHIKALHAAGAPRVQDERKLADFISLNHMEKHTTHFKDVFRLPPACALSATPEGIEGDGHRRIWEFDLTRRITLPGDDDYVEAFNALFDRIVKDHSRSIKPLGVSMSGGIDSAAVATRTAQLMEGQARLRTYTAVPQAGFDAPAPRGHYNDETSLVHETVAMNPRLDPQFLPFEGLSPDDHLETHFEASEQPMRNACNRVWIEGIMRRAQADGVGVMLTGQSGNMTISWEGEAALSDWFGRGLLLRWWRGVEALSGYREKPRTDHIKRTLRYLAPEILMRLRRRLRNDSSPVRNFNPINPAFAEKHDVFTRAKAMGYDPFYRQNYTGREYRRRALFATADFPGDISANWRAAYGVDQRDPTGDMRLIEFCLAIPQNQFLGGGEPRWLARRAFSSHLPRSVLWNIGRGIQDPGWFERIRGKQAEYRDEIRRMRNSSRVSEALDLDRLAQLVENWPDAARAGDIDIMLKYRLALLRGMHAARYIRWINRENW